MKEGRNPDQPRKPLTKSFRKCHMILCVVCLHVCERARARMYAFVCVLSCGQSRKYMYSVLGISHTLMNHMYCIYHQQVYFLPQIDFVGRSSNNIKGQLCPLVSMSEN